MKKMSNSVARNVDFNELCWCKQIILLSTSQVFSSENRFFSFRIREILKRIFGCFAILWSFLILLLDFLFSLEDIYDSLILEFPFFKAR